MPAATAVTKPVLLTVATLVVADTHGLEAAGVAVPVSWVVDPAQTFSVPVMVGRAFTVIIADPDVETLQLGVAVYSTLTKL